MLEIRNLYLFYGKKKVLDNINLKFEKGRFYAIVGKNSSGKTTLINCISGIKRYEGDIWVDKKDLKKISDRERAEKISCLYQNVIAVPFTVSEMCAFGRSAFGDTNEECERRVQEALDVVGISHLYGRKVSEISGGERQLCYFAMNLCQNSDIMLLDEPTSNLDAEHEAKILSAAKDLCRKEKTVICVIHNLSQAIKYADSMIVLDKGNCIFSGSKEECLTGQIIEKSFGVKKHTVNDEIFFSV